MNAYSKTSEDRLRTCQPLLQDLFRAVLPVMNHSIICGHRGQGAQEQAFISGKSMLQWPRSKHNKTPSEAVDVMPWPIDWNDIERIAHFAGIVKGVASMKKVPRCLGRGLEDLQGLCPL